MINMALPLPFKSLYSDNSKEKVFAEMSVLLSSEGINPLQVSTASTPALVGAQALRWQGGRRKFSAVHTEAFFPCELKSGNSGGYHS